MCVHCVCIIDVNGLEFTVKTGDYQGLIRTSSMDLLDHLEGESDQSFDSCQSSMSFSDLVLIYCMEMTVLGRVAKNLLFNQTVRFLLQGLVDNFTFTGQVKVWYFIQYFLNVTYVA